MPFAQKKQLPPIKGQEGDKANFDKTNKGHKGFKKKGQKQSGKCDLRKKYWKGGWGDWGRDDWGENNDCSEGASSKTDNTKATEPQEEKTECGKRKQKEG